MGNVNMPFSLPRQINYNAIESVNKNTEQSVAENMSENTGVDPGKVVMSCIAIIAVINMILPYEDNHINRLSVCTALVVSSCVIFAFFLAQDGEEIQLNDIQNKNLSPIEQIIIEKRGDDAEDEIFCIEKSA